MKKIQIDQTLSMRWPRPSDAAELFELIDQNRHYLRQWMSWLDATQNQQGVEDFIASCSHHVEQKTGFHYGIIKKNKIIGVIGLSEINQLHRHANIGYWLSENERGQAIIKKATYALLELAFGPLKLNKVVIRCASANHASQAIALCLGFTHEGTLRQNEWLYDRYVDHEIFSLLAEEFFS